MKRIKGIQIAAVLLLLSHEGYSGTEGDSNQNVFYGYGAGYKVNIGADSGAAENVCVGYHTGYLLDSATENSILGAYSGANIGSGIQNLIVGGYAGMADTHGSRNVYLGGLSGSGIDGKNVNGCVFIGHKSAYTATRDNTLYITNTDTDNPLIYGEFDTPLVRINADLNVTGNTAIDGKIYFLNPVTIDGNMTVKRKIQGESAMIQGPLYLSSEESRSGSDPMVMLSLIRANLEADSYSDVSIALKNSVENFQWNIQTSEEEWGLAFSKLGSGVAEMTLTPANGPDGLQILMGDGGKYSNGQWLDASSRAYKENIRALGKTEALTAFDRLQPVHYNYKTDRDEPVVGFIAEDVPDLVAPRDHKSLSPLEMTALLTEVIQVQRKKREAADREMLQLQKEQKKLERELKELKTRLQASGLRAGRDLR